MGRIRAIMKRCLPQSVIQLLKRSQLRFRLNDHDWYEDKERFEFLRKALITLKFNGIDGDYAEFGCYGANTFRMVYRILSKYSYDVGPFHLWAFDSFEGLPGTSDAKDEHPEWVKGRMTISLKLFNELCRASGIPGNAYTAVPGLYDQSLAPAASGPRPEKIRLAYVDCDMFTSTSAVLSFLMPRLQHGMILAFDDYYCYSATLPSGERLAVAENFRDNSDWRLVPYVQFGWHGMSFIVEATNEANFAPNR
ncbi:MAG: hypothetical protein HZA17_13740 [Nitrospirae bacterium]|nr:hypothetical protein [Nitrospirota bacterium]